MKLLTEYLSTKVKASNIVANDDTLRKILLDEIKRLGNTGDFNHINISNCTTLNSLCDCYYGNDNNIFKNFNGDISKWDTSNITNLCSTFRGCVKFNCDLSGWDVSNVTDMDHTFCDCIEFNKPLNNWRVNNVTIMAGMFCGAQKFNQPLNKWNVSNVEDMNYLFDEAYEFNQDISMWNVDKVMTKVNIFKNCPIQRNFIPQFPKI